MNIPKNRFSSVAVIIPTRNRLRYLKNSIQSLQGMYYDHSVVEIFIINNDSTDNTQKYLHNQFPHIKIINLNRNIGFGPALNIGIINTQSEYVFITNDDVIFDKYCLFELVQIAISHKNAGIVGGKMYFKDQPAKLALTGFRVNTWLGYHPYDISGIDQVREMDVATGGCMLIRRAMLKKTGLFDEDFFFTGEDYDLCFRAKKAGFKIMYAPKAILWHELLNTGKKKDYYIPVYMHYRGKFRFMLKHASFIHLLIFTLLQLTVGPYYVSIISKKFVIFPMYHALLWNIFHIINTLKARKSLQREYASPVTKVRNICW